MGWLLFLQVTYAHGFWLERLAEIIWGGRGQAFLMHRPLIPFPLSCFFLGWRCSFRAQWSWGLTLEGKLMGQGIWKTALGWAQEKHHSMWQNVISFLLYQPPIPALLSLFLCLLKPLGWAPSPLQAVCGNSFVQSPAVSWAAWWLRKLVGSLWEMLPSWHLTIPSVPLSRTNSAFSLSASSQKTIANPPLSLLPLVFTFFYWFLQRPKFLTLYWL